MIRVALVVLLHGDDAHMDLVYFWAAVLIALTPVLIFGGLGVWVLREMWRKRGAAEDQGGRPVGHP